MKTAMRRMIGLSFLVLGAVAGCADATPVGSSADEVQVRSDASARAAIERAAAGAVYVSEADYPYVWAGAALAAGETLTPEVVIAKLGHLVENEKGAALHAAEGSFDDFWSFDDCSENTYPGPEECAKDKLLAAALRENLRDLRVFYVAPYENPNGDGVPTIMLLGITPEGNIGGVFTVAVWT